MRYVGTHPTSPLTAYPRIHNLKAFDGKIYTGHGDWTTYPACIIASYEPGANTWNCEYAPGGSSVGVYREIDGRLYVLHCNPSHYDDFQDFSYYQPGVGWRDRTPIGLYVGFDFCKLGSTLFFCGTKDSHEGPPNAGGNSAVLMRSADDGKTWNAANTSSGYSRFYYCFALNGRVYTQGGTSNGQVWTNGSPLSGYDSLYKPTVIQSGSSSLMVGMADHLPGMINSTPSSPLITFNGSTITTLTDAVLDFTYDGTDLFALRSTGIYRGTLNTASVITWTLLPITGIPTNATALEVLAGQVWVGTGSGGLWRQFLNGTEPPALATPSITNLIPDGLGRSIAFEDADIILGAHEAGQRPAGTFQPAAGRVDTWRNDGPADDPHWGNGTTLTSASPKISGWFGKDLSIKDRLLGVVEAGYDTTGQDRGSAARVHLYTRGSGTSTWQSRYVLNIPFAQSVTVDSDLLVVGSANPAAYQTAGKPSLYPYLITRSSQGGVTSVFPKWGNSTVGLSPVVEQWGYRPVARCAMSDRLILAGFSGDISRDGGVGMISVWNRDSVRNAGAPPPPIQEISTIQPDRYGFAVAVTGDYAAVGAPRDDTAAKQAGAVYLYDVTTSSQPLVFRQKIVSPVAQDAAAFGSAVALKGDTLLVGSPGNDGGTITGRGVVYIYHRVGNEWTLTGELPPPAGVQGGYGIEVSLGSYWMAAGARYSDSALAMNERVAIQAQPDGYVEWAGLQQLPSPDRSPTSDPDDDGLCNLVEYASGLNPLLNQNQSLSSITLSGLPVVVLNATGSPVCQYLSRSADGRLKQTLEISTDLRNWTPLGITPRRRIAGTDLLELLEVPLPANGASQYVRLRLERIVP